MSEAGWRNLSIALAVVLVVLLAAGGGLLVFGGRGSSGASPTLTATASASGTERPSASPSETSTETATATPTATPKPTPSPTKAPTPSPTLATYPTTTIAFDNLKLDDSQTGSARTIAFGSNGPSDIVAVVKVTTSGTARVCLKPGSASAFCQSGSGTINFKGQATGATGSWTLTLVGQLSTPVVDLTITWRTKAPKVTLSNFRFDGTGSSATNGFTATVKARANGNLAFAFSWGATYPWDLLVQDQTGGTNSEPTGSGTSMSHSIGVTKNHQYRSTLQNTAAGSGSAVPLNGTISWP